MNYPYPIEIPECKFIMNALEVKQLIKNFNRREVVRSISFCAEKGQLLALLGPSGCGKTTTLRMIAGLETADDGEIWIEGALASCGRKVVISQKQRHIGMVFQDLALWPHMTVYENIEFGLKANDLIRAERRKKIETVLNKINMQNYAREYPTRLSGGQQQLIAIARAIVTEPRLLLMDEPLSNIDVKLREDIRQEIRRIQQETQITTVYVTHDQDDAFLLADKIAVINNGILEQIGIPEEIYSSPTSLFVANFVGEANIMQVKIVGKDKVLTPWGELVCNTKGREGKNAYLFFRPHQAVIDDSGHYYGTIINRDFVAGGYKYRVSTSGIEFKLQDQTRHDIGKFIKFSIRKMDILFF
ncbi:MAG: ABC transporter ATP-binding protein [Planctomycetes bacterium]|uniref:ABC transporter ATP-binding protein n=1 Tax=Candidatus Wunengus californicus TaxID=3367619 RepID=UPI004025D196|nr:ABC transporter ATP-binding protein [Planctomycetota bacterium]MBI4221688.1 ABC transporter ATP-binding protein [Planctomycetota bacterium]